MHTGKLSPLVRFVRAAITATVIARSLVWAPTAMAAPSAHRPVRGEHVMKVSVSASACLAQPDAARDSQAAVQVSAQRLALVAATASASVAANARSPIWTDAKQTISVPTTATTASAQQQLWCFTVYTYLGDDAQATLIKVDVECFLL